MRGPITSSALGLCSLAVVLNVACGLHTNVVGIRPLSDVDRAARVVRRYRCMLPEPTTPGMEGVHETPTKQEIEVRLADTGPIVVDPLVGPGAWINHWQTERADHFFAWFDGLPSGFEIVVSKDGSTAAKYIWGEQNHDPGAYRLEKQADGTTRPRGVPGSVWWCYPSDQIEARRAAGQPLLARTGAAAIELHDRNAVSGAPELVETECGHEGPTAKQIPTEQLGFGLPMVKGPAWEWVPSGIYLPPDQKDIAYVGFGRHGYGWNRHFYMVKVTPEGQFTFTIGRAQYAGQIKETADHQNVVDVHAQLLDDTPGELWCTYIPADALR